jgi:5'-deoxynucleotidase YfbR-like HD superfamily hydrolase
MLHMIVEEDAERFDGLHWAVARQAFGPAATKADRYAAKRGVFGHIYGGGIPTLAKQVGVTEPEMTAIVESLKALTPGLAAWSDQIRTGVRRGYTQFPAYSGRIIHFPAAYPHKAPNYAIQGSCREILVDALVRWRDTRWGHCTLLPVHDELIVVVPAEDAEEATRELARCMETELFGVKIVADPNEPRSPGLTRHDQHRPTPHWRSDPVNPPAPAPTPAGCELSEAGLTRALADLGDTPDQVADTLRRGNHHGAVCSEATCPITSYLAATFPTATYVRVTSIQALLRHPGGTVQVWSPRPVRHFVDRFDLSGDFADLASDHAPIARASTADLPVDHYTRDTADAVIALGRLALRFGRVNRITYHDDATTPESDTDHTVMLGLIACAFAAAHLPDLDLGLIAQYALVHDLVEVHAGDTPTLRALTPAAKAAKKRREHAAWRRLGAEFRHTLPWVPDLIARYESRATPEARYVKALDKLLPKITHIVNDLATIREQDLAGGCASSILSTSAPTWSRCRSTSCSESASRAGSSPQQPCGHHHGLL